MEQGDTRGHVSIENFGDTLTGLKSCLVICFNLCLLVLIGLKPLACVL